MGGEVKAVSKILSKTLVSRLKTRVFKRRRRDSNPRYHHWHNGFQDRSNQKPIFGYHFKKHIKSALDIS